MIPELTTPIKIDIPGIGTIESADLYLKSEADKVIAHNKYKRCEAMARWCRMHDEFIQLESERLGLPQSTLFLEYRRKAMWWNKWHKRWLELAEEPTWAKFLQLIRKEAK